MFAAVEAKTRTPGNNVSILGLNFRFGGNTEDLTRGSPGVLEGTAGGIAAGLPCTETVASVLEALGFLPGQVTDVRYSLRAAGDSGGNSRLQGFNAWVSFNDRSGYVVVSLRPNCRFNTFYTRSGLNLPFDL